MQNRGIFGAILMVGSLITIMIGTLNNSGAGLIGIAMYISIVLFIVGIIDVVLYAVSFRKSKYPNLMWWTLKNVKGEPLVHLLYLSF